MDHSLSCRDLLIRRFLPLADALARRFHSRFPDLLERDDLLQVARLALVKAAGRIQDERTAPAYLRAYIQGELRHHLRDHALLVRLPARARGNAPWRHQSLDVPLHPSEDGEPSTTALEALPSPVAAEADSTAALEHPFLQQQLERLQQQSPAWAAALQLTVLEGHSLRESGRALGVSPMTVSRWRRLGLEQIRQQLEPQAAAIA